MVKTWFGVESRTTCNYESNIMDSHLDTLALFTGCGRACGASIHSELSHASRVYYARSGRPALGHSIAVNCAQLLPTPSGSRPSLVITYTLVYGVWTPACLAAIVYMRRVIHLYHRDARRIRRCLEGREAINESLC